EAHAEDVGGAIENLLQEFRLVIVEPLLDLKALAQRGSQQPGAGGGSDEGERRQLDLHRASRGARIDGHLQPVVLHRRVEVLLDGGVKSVNLVDEENVPGLEVGEQPGQIPLSFQGGPGGDVKADAQLGGNNVGEGSFSQSRRAGKQTVVQGL